MRYLLCEGRACVCGVRAPQRVDDRLFDSPGLSVTLDAEAGHGIEPVAGLASRAFSSPHPPARRRRRTSRGTTPCRCRTMTGFRLARVERHIRPFGVPVSRGRWGPPRAVSWRGSRATPASYSVSMNDLWNSRCQSGAWPSPHSRYVVEAERARAPGRLRSVSCQTSSGSSFGTKIRSSVLDAVVARFDDRVSDAVPATVRVGLDADGLPPRRPDVALLVPEIDVLSPLVLDQILFPARQTVELGVRPPAVPAPRLGDRQAVVAVADDIDPRTRRARGGDDVLRPVLGEVAVLCAMTISHVLVPADVRSDDPEREPLRRLEPPLVRPSIVESRCMASTSAYCIPAPSVRPDFRILQEQVLVSAAQGEDVQRTVHSAPTLTLSVLSLGWKASTATSEHGGPRRASNGIADADPEQDRQREVVRDTVAAGSALLSP